MDYVSKKSSQPQALPTKDVHKDNMVDFLESLADSYPNAVVKKSIYYTVLMNSSMTWGIESQAALEEPVHRRAAWHQDS